MDTGKNTLHVYIQLCYCEARHSATRQSVHGDKWSCERRLENVAAAAAAACCPRLKGGVARVLQMILFLATNLPWRARIVSGMSLRHRWAPIIIFFCVFHPNHAWPQHHMHVCISMYHALCILQPYRYRTKHFPKRWGGISTHEYYFKYNYINYIFY